MHNQTKQQAACYAHWSNAAIMLGQHRRYRARNWIKFPLVLSNNWLIILLVLKTLISLVPPNCQFEWKLFCKRKQMVCKHYDHDDKKLQCSTSTQTLSSSMYAHGCEALQGYWYLFGRTSSMKLNSSFSCWSFRTIGRKINLMCSYRWLSIIRARNWPCPIVQESRKDEFNFTELVPAWQ